MVGYEKDIELKMERLFDTLSEKDRGVTQVSKRSSLDMGGLAIFRNFSI